MKPGLRRPAPSRSVDGTRVNQNTLNTSISSVADSRPSPPAHGVDIAAHTQRRIDRRISLPDHDRLPPSPPTPPAERDRCATGFTGPRLRRDGQTPSSPRPIRRSRTTVGSRTPTRPPVRHDVQRPPSTHWNAADLPSTSDVGNGSHTSRKTINHQHNALGNGPGVNRLPRPQIKSRVMGGAMHDGDRVPPAIGA